MPACLRSATCAVLIAVGCSPAVAGQAVDLGGHWEGEIELPGTPLQVMLDFERAKGGGVDAWSGTIDIPAQSATDLPLVEISIVDRRVRFSIAGVPGNPTFSGVFRDGEINGDFSQGAARLRFRLGREAVEVARRPQDPRPPFPYRQEEVSYLNGDVTLAATLTLPAGNGPFPAAVLITGSGPQNRDQEIFGHRPFAVLADALARRGVAVLRSDDRGVGGSTGDVNAATSADFATDVLAAVGLLRGRTEIAADRIGVIGHSEGGLVGPLAAVESASVAFVVMLAGPGVSGAEILPLQNRRLAEAAGGDPTAVAAQVRLVERMLELLGGELDAPDLREKLHALALQQLELGGEAARQALGDDAETVIEQQIDRLLTPWFGYFLAYDPRPTLGRLRVPVLALNGSLDLQVDAEQNLPEIERALVAAGNGDVTIRRLEGLNHLFQHASTGTVEEYGRIDETMAPEVLDLIGDWILERFAGGSG